MLWGLTRRAVTLFITTKKWMTQMRLEKFLCRYLMLPFHAVYWHLLAPKLILKGLSLYLFRKCKIPNVKPVLKVALFAARFCSALYNSFQQAPKLLITNLTKLMYAIITKMFSITKIFTIGRRPPENKWARLPCRDEFCKVNYWQRLW